MDFSRLFTINRSIARALGPYFVRSPLTPNQITTLSLLAGLLGAFFMFQWGKPFLLLGALFLQASYILDNCDGEVARAKGLQSRFGMWYDYLADLAVELSLWTALYLGSRLHGLPPEIIYFFIAACAGSVINFLRVAVERSDAGTVLPLKNPLWKSLDVLRGDGDPSVLIWLLCLIGYPGYVLVLGGIYVNLLWIFSAFRVYSFRFHL